MHSAVSYILHLISYILPFRDFLYILQSEDYRTDRFLHWLPRFFFRRHIEVRGTLIFTPRATLLAGGSVFLHALVIVGIVLFFHSSPLILSLLILLSFLCVPLFILWSHILTLPLFTLAHARIWSTARAKIATMPDLTVIMIVGSYGKTKTRLYVEEMLRHQRRVATPPGNINTETGVARWIVDTLPASSEVLILEADAYAQGDIARMCDIARPHISVITALGDQHAERLKSRETLIAATQEVFEHSHEVSTLIADTDTWDTLTKAGYVYEGKTNTDSSVVPHEYASLEQSLISLSYTNRQAALRALSVAHALHIPERFVESALRTTPLPERRQELRNLAGYDGMDDSYNISLETARSALRAARAEADTRHKKLLVLVAGFPESLDPASAHTHLALECLEHAHHTVLIQSMFTPLMQAAMAHDKSRYTILPSINNSVLTELPSRFSHSEWFILLFNELGDLYH